jgi:peptidoglycan/LPS O-acetylase OafA/YrhL
MRAESPAIERSGATRQDAGPEGQRRPHLSQVDIVRLITFVCVIGVHAIPMTTSAQSAGAGAAEVFLHFTRNAFFLLSAFVLVHAHHRAGVRVRSFWPRRFLYIGVPYLVWTTVYWLLGTGNRTDFGGLGSALVTGTGWYHLYFLLVSMQLYLVFPALLALVRRTAGHHVALFTASFALELVVMALTHWATWPGAFWGGVYDHAYVLLPTYQFYFVAGALAAVHHDRLHAWVVRRPYAVLAVVAGAAVLLEGVYLTQLAVTGSPAQASDPLQPSIVPWSLAVTLGLYAVGCGYARHRRAGRRLGRLVDFASVISFGVYLVHPLVLNVVLGRWLAYGPGHLGPPVSTALAWLGTLVVSFAFAALAVRTPLALSLTGRRRLRASAAPRRAPRPSVA